MITKSGTVGLVEGIMDDICLVVICARDKRRPLSSTIFENRIQQEMKERIDTTLTVEKVLPSQKQ